VDDQLVALIRGINVGTANRVAMADLRALLEELGYTDVRTVLNSGNAVFRASEAAAADAAETAGAANAADVAADRIAAALASRLGVSARVMVLTAAELRAAAAHNPLSGVADNPSRLLVAFLARPGDRPLLEALLDEGWAPEALALGQRVAYLWCPDGVIASRLAKAVERVLGDTVTSRNWATVMKIRALVEAGA
jgi:uncharacterized protein (DUF1697 family)